MTIRESVKTEIDALPDNALYAVRDFLLFQKHRDILEMSDTAYLNSIFVNYDYVASRNSKFGRLTLKFSTWHGIC